jgi:hypothetical protein
MIMDTQYTGFIQIPNTEVIMKLNVKPHVDITADSGRMGDPNRFVTAKIPVTGDPTKGGGEQFNMNANGSQIRWDNVGATYNLTESDTLLGLVNYGEGTGGMGNDSGFANSDAAFNANGELEALSYVSGLLALTHRWNDQWRSTATYGYVDLDSTDPQTGDAYQTTTYASANIICQVRRQMSVGLEGLYGDKETKDGSSGELWRVQVGLVYSIF